MIRIVTGARLAGLRQEATQSRARAVEVQERADAAYAVHQCEIRVLREQAASAENDAAVVREEAVALEKALAAVRSELAERGERLETVERELSTVRRTGAFVYLLLHHGEPHSIHLTEDDAHAYAATRGAPRTGWVRETGRPPGAVPTWRCVPFTADADTFGFRSVLARLAGGFGGGS
ncbi:hypothetical protein [Streptomyces sp. NPDC005012]|uniref:hypothetical protein n=1 Tax=Streptomyces sp. NPDC005012 TaxID=3154558 RepID=UPI0033B41EE2